MALYQMVRDLWTFGSYLVGETSHSDWTKRQGKERRREVGGVGDNREKRQKNILLEFAFSV